MPFFIAFLIIFICCLFLFIALLAHPSLFFVLLFLIIVAFNHANVTVEERKPPTCPGCDSRDYLVRPGPRNPMGFIKMALAFQKNAFFCECQQCGKQWYQPD
jgi:hypothetical protein